MHQQSRYPARVSSPASSPQTNPTRTNNQRDRVRAGSDASIQDAGPASRVPGGDGPGPSRDSVRKLDQIIQNFYQKAAVLILQSRLHLRPAGGRPDGRRSNKWFAIDTDETDDYRDELRVFKSSGGFENRPPPMIIETYIDASGLSSSQSLVMVDDSGRRWDVLETLNSLETSDDNPRRRHLQKPKAEVILERWRIELRCLPDVPQDEFGPALPTVYKRSIVFFRSLFVTTHIMPCWKYSQQALTKGTHPALEVKCRILTADPEYTSYDPLRLPLHDGRDVVTEYVFTDVEMPVGRFYASVTYRNDCSFRVADAESLLSSRFMGADENLFKPSAPSRREQGHGRLDPCAEPGSLPSQRLDRGTQEPHQTYGSLSTFHGAGALGTSPITALKSVRPIGSDTSSPSTSMSASIEQPAPPNSLPIRGGPARPSLRTYDVTNRRPSVSFQPFKAGPLSASPRIPDTDGTPSSPQSLTRPGQSGHPGPGNRSSLTAGMAASLRGPSTAPQEAPTVTGSPRPTSRFSSSFTHRRGRPSFSGQIKGDDDQASSGKQSLSSSVQPGSGLLTEVGGLASSGSLATDDDNISEFLKALDSRKTLKSFEPDKKGDSLASKRTAAQLSKFHLMRETNNALTDSMTSSIHLQRSSSSSSRQLANVPSMVNPASMSVSSSPGKPLSPHTPHTPAIPSRLSENSIIDYQPPQDQRTEGRQSRTTPDMAGTTEEEPAEDEDDVTPMTTQQDRGPPADTDTTADRPTAAIDIPLSPRPFHHHHHHHPRAHHHHHHHSATGGAGRRASSVAHQRQRSLAGEVDSYAVGGQPSGSGSASVEGAAASVGEREAPTLSALLAYRRGGGAGELGGRDGPQRRRWRRASAPSVEGGIECHGHGYSHGHGVAGEERGSAGSGCAGAPSVAGGGGRGGTRSPLHRGAGRGSFSSAAGAGTGRYAGSVEGADEEPLLFAMSELERDSRRSLEEGRGGASASGSGNAAGRYEPRGILRKGW